jgi:hypothetical protein
MKKWFLALILGVSLIGGTAVLVQEPVYAACSTSILPPEWCDPGKDLNGDGKAEGGEAIWELLALIVRILTGGVGVLATIGIIWTAIKYSKAGDDVSQVETAKKRLVEIMIGLVAYALMAVAANFLIPGGVF